MGKHREWRKIAKRERRRRIRTKIAISNDKIFNNKEYLEEQQMLHTIELEMIEQTNIEENEKWLQAERIAIAQWQTLQEKRKKIQQERLEKEAKLKLEWEMEQKKKKAEAERLKALEEGNRLKQELFMKNLEEFLSGDSTEPPRELLFSKETRPNGDVCPFFSKTACCRFGDMCSRNHQHPGISKILLATNFFVHFGMDHATPSEYDTDIMLEYEETDTYKQFKEFFYDVLEEFQKFGKVVMFKVCNNFEKHLRGNVYIEYEELRCAVAAYRALHTRWYGGRTLSLQFCLISSWKHALCGLQFRNCPKGRACNFLHVFKNPNNLFVRHDNSDRKKERSPSRSWRWSESPEPEEPRRSRQRLDERRKHDDDRNNKRKNDRRDSSDDYRRKRYDTRCDEDYDRNHRRNRHEDDKRKEDNDNTDDRNLRKKRNDDDRNHNKKRLDNDKRNDDDDGNDETHHRKKRHEERRNVNEDGRNQRKSRHDNDTFKYNEYEDGRNQRKKNTDKDTRNDDDGDNDIRFQRKKRHDDERRIENDNDADENLRKNYRCVELKG